MFLRRFLSVTLCLIMLMCYAIPVSADNLSAIKYGVGESFIIVIPGGFSIGSSGKSQAEVTVKEILIAHGSTLKVFISGDDYDGSWELIDVTNNSNKLTYTIGTTEGGKDIENNSVILYANSGEKTEETKTIHFTVADNNVRPGYYNDFITFIVDVE